MARVKTAPRRPYLIAPRLMMPRTPIRSPTPENDGIRSPSTQTSNQEQKYRGVRKRPSGRFGVEIRNPTTKNRDWLGMFDSAIEAARAYDQKAILFYGAKAVTNFPITSYIATAESPASPPRE